MSQTQRNDSIWSKSSPCHKQTKLSPFCHPIKQLSSINSDLNNLENRFDNFEKTLRSLQVNQQNIKKAKVTEDRESKENKSNRFKIEKIGKLTNNSRKVKIENKIYTCRNFPASYFHNIQALAQNSLRRDRLAKKKNQKLKGTKETSRYNQNMKESKKSKFMDRKPSKYNASRCHDQEKNKLNDYRYPCSKEGETNMVQLSNKMIKVKHVEQFDDIKQSIDSPNNQIGKPLLATANHHPQFVNTVNINSKKLLQPQKYRLLQKIIHNNTVEIPIHTTRPQRFNLEEQFDCFLMRLTKRSNLNNSLNHNLKLEVLLKERESTKLKQTQQVNDSNCSINKKRQQKLCQHNCQWESKNRKKLAISNQGTNPNSNESNQHPFILSNRYKRQPSIAVNLLRQNSDHDKGQREPQWKRSHSQRQNK